MNFNTLHVLQKDQAALRIWFSQQGNPMWWNFTRQKNLDISLFFLFFPPTFPKEREWITPYGLCYFLLEKSISNFLGRESKWNILFLFLRQSTTHPCIFSPDIPKRKGMHKSLWTLLFFTRKVNFQLSWKRVKMKYFIFVPLTEHNTPLSELLDQTIHWEWPKGQVSNKQAYTIKLCSLIWCF